MNAYVAAELAVSSRPGAVAMPSAPATSLVAHLSIAERPGAHPGPDVRDAGQLAQRRQRPVLAARSVDDRQDDGAGLEHGHRLAELEGAVGVVPAAVRRDGQPDDVVDRGVQRVRDRGGGGDRDGVLAALAAAHDGDAGAVRDGDGHGRLLRTGVALT